MQSLRIPRNAWVHGACSIFAIALLACALPCRAADKVQQPPKDTAEAEKWVQKLEEAAGGRDFQFDLEKGLLTYKSRSGNTIVLSLWTVNAISSVQWDKNQGSGAWKVHWTYEGSKTEWWISDRSRDEVERFRLGLIFLVSQIDKKLDAHEAEVFEQFKLKAQVWRSVSQKPTMTDDAYPHKVLAENAYKEKNLVKAMDEYELALTAFPTWPEGQFNEALIAAELGNYRLAVHRMKEYLLLVPDAPDAQQAKDNVIIWQDKIAHF